MFKLGKDKNDSQNQDWKQKAKERRIEIKKLKKQIQELSKSKDKWMKKAEHFNAKYQMIDDMLKKNDY
jgi:hypothetical protein